MDQTDVPSVSIIIPLYNAEKYISLAIQSALNQTWPNKEIIIINDGSTDDSLAVAGQFKSDTVKIFSQQNQGASVARNYGLKEAKGAYIQFLDADDLLSEDKIEAQMQMLANYPEHIGLCGTIHFQDGTDPFSYTVQHDWIADETGNAVDFLLRLYGGPANGNGVGGMVQPNAWLTPKILIDRAGVWNEMKNPDDDGEFFCRVILAGKGVKYAYEGINYYRKFNVQNSWSGQKSQSSYETVIRSTDLKFDHLKKRSGSPLIEKIFARQYWEIGVAAYPQYKSLSKKAIDKAVAYGFDGDKYRAGPLSTVLSKIIGWRLVRRLTWLRYKI